MPKVKGHLREIIKYVLLLGLGIQAAIGGISFLVWIWKEASWLTGVDSLLGLCVLGALGYGVLRIWKSSLSRRMCMLGTVGMITSPVVLQTCLEAGTELAGAVALSILCMVMLGTVRRIGKKWGKCFVILAAVVITLVSSSMGVGAPSVSARLASRLCFPELYSGVVNTPQELQDQVGYLEMRDALRSADGIYARLYPSLLERHGNAAGADAACLMLAKYGFENYTKAIVGNILWDAAGYHVPLIVSQLQLMGHGYDSITGYNYGILTENMGSLAVWYWKYSVMWNVLSVLLVSGIFAVQRGLPKESTVFLIIILETAIFGYIMQGAGFFDYKNLPLAELLRLGFLLEAFKILNENKGE